jgi:hypothetical protein
LGNVVMTVPSQLFKKATLFFSRDDISTIASVIPTMDKIEDLFSGRTRANMHPAIVSAMGLARKTMNRYYSKTDSSYVYRIAMSMYYLVHVDLILTSLVLHPGLKTEYFHSREWEREWIDTAEELVRTAFSKYKAAVVTSEPQITEATVCFYIHCATMS